MKRLLVLFLLIIGFNVHSQTLLTEASEFHIKTIDGTPIYLFPLLDNDNMIVVIDFFSTTCGPCQDFAPDFQQSYVDFGENNGNVYFMGIDWGNDNEGIHEFDSVFGLTYPTASGVQGGGNIVFTDYQIQSYPTVIVIKPNHQISNQYVWEPTNENINQAILDAGGLLVGTKETEENSFSIYPNPTHDNFNVLLSDLSSEEIYLDIIDARGQIVYQEVISTNNNKTVSLKTNSFENGVYFVRVISADGKMKTKSLIVNR